MGIFNVIKRELLGKGVGVWVFLKPLTISLPKRIIRMSKEVKHFLQKSSFGLIVSFLTRRKDGFSLQISKQKENLLRQKEEKTV